MGMDWLKVQNLIISLICACISNQANFALKKILILRQNPTLWQHCCVCSYLARNLELDSEPLNLAYYRFWKCLMLQKRLHEQTCLAGDLQPLIIMCIRTHVIMMSYYNIQSHAQLYYSNIYAWYTPIHTTRVILWVTTYLTHNIYMCAHGTHMII